MNRWLYPFLILIIHIQFITWVQPTTNIFSEFYSYMLWLKQGNGYTTKFPLSIKYQNRSNDIMDQMILLWANITQSRVLGIVT